MNRLFYFLTIIMILVLAALPASAGEPTEYEIPEVGTEINGFKAAEVTWWDTYATYVVKLEHVKTGSVLYWLANDNIDRSFMIAFRTPINDNTGMPHVFEHATLGGSKKYPGANTFTELCNKTSNTYLNAQTGQYYTLYPMASTSEEQLLKYIDYYMNGLTEPLALEEPYALMREAFRYELDDPEGEISLQGVVYSEMQGRLTQSNWAMQNYDRMMWPGSYVTTVSGGDPNYIPDLTIDAVKAFHEQYYHPSNATMYLTGDVDLSRFLELLDNDFLSKYEYREIPIEDSNYTPLKPGNYAMTFSYPAEIGTSDEKAAIIFYGHPFVINDFNDMAMLDYVCAYMNDTSSPLQRLKDERLPEATISMVALEEPEGKCSLRFKASGVDEADKETFRQLCDDALAKLLEEGVNEDVLNGMLVENRFIELTGLDSSSVYLSLSLSMAESWALYGDRDAWKMSAEFEKNLTDIITVENLNAAARKYWSDLDTSVVAVTVPDPGLKEENDADLRARLAAMKADMTPEEVDALVEQTKAYQAFVEESNAIPMPEDLNALSVANLPEEVSYTLASETNIGGVRVITSEIDSPLILVSFRTDTSAIPFEDLFDFAEYTWLLESIGTEKYSREELPSKMSLVSAGMTMFNSTTEDPETRAINSYFLARWFALPETLEDSFAMVEEILYHTDFSDYDYIRADAASNYAQFQMYMEYNALSFGVLAAGSGFSPAAKLDYYLNTEAQMAYWDKLSKYTDEEMDALVRKFEGFRVIMLNKNGVTLTVMGNNENIMRSVALGYNMISEFDDTVREGVDYAARIEALPLHTAVVTGGDMVYNLSAADLEAAGYEKNDGGLRVVMNIIDDKLFYPEIRVKNSAYGGYSSLYSDYVLLYYSNSDPKVAETFAVYQKSGDFLRNLEISESELEGYLTSAYGSLTRPVGPLSAALVGIDDLMNGQNSYEKTIKMIRDIKAFKPEDIAKYADLADAMVSENASRVTTGSKTLIEANAALYDYINYNLLNFDGAAEPSDAAESPNADEELIGVIAALSPEEIEAMIASMDDDDMRSVVSYVIDYFTDENGRVDEKKVFELVGAFMNDKWSDDEIEEAVEELEPDDDDSVSDQEKVDGWMKVFDTFMEQLDEENMTDWLVNFFSGTENSAEQPESGTVDNALSSLLQGLFSAFVTEAND